MGAPRDGAQDRIEREREFHDARYSSEGRGADRFYAVAEASFDYFREAIHDLPPGSQVLDYGCGDGAYAALHAAAAGHEVTAVDISPVALEHAREKAEAQGVAAHINFKVMNAEALDFDADSFDFVYGVGVIHHLDLAPALDEVARVVRPDGTVFFLEPLGHNPFINWYRRRTPSQRSEDEHPLLLSDLDLVRERFATVDLRYFHLSTMAALPLAGRSAFAGAVDRLNALDRWLFRTPLRRWAWIVGITATGSSVARPSS